MIIPGMRPVMTIICVAILAGCQQSLPTAPSNLATGIVVSTIVGRCGWNLTLEGLKTRVGRYETGRS